MRFGKGGGGGGGGKYSPKFGRVAHFLNPNLFQALGILSAGPPPPPPPIVFVPVIRSFTPPAVYTEPGTGFETLNPFRT